MESIMYSEIAAMEDVEKGTEFCRKYVRILNTAGK